MVRPNEYRWVIDENCIFNSFEACRRTVISGNRGFCTQNPAFVEAAKRSAISPSKTAKECTLLNDIACNPGIDHQIAYVDASGKVRAVTSRARAT